MLTDLEPDTLWTAHITQDGTRAWVSAVDADGEDLGSVASMLATEGVFAVNLGFNRGALGLLIDADGRWTVEISDADEAPRWSGEAPYTGTRSDVFVVEQSAVGSDVAFVHDGNGAVSVIAYDDDGTWLELLVNGVGELRTTATLPEGAHFLTVDVSTDQGPSGWALAPK